MSRMSAAEADLLRCDLAGEVLRSVGRLHLKALGWSMLPSILPGDTVFVQTASIKEVGLGDIVLFSRGGRFFIHRVVEISDYPEPARVITCGDAMPQSDPPVNASELLGKVEHIIRNGRLIRTSRTPGFAARTISAAARRSHLAARAVFGLHQLRASRKQVSQ